MVFFGEARWEDHAAEHGAHGDFKPHESPPVDAAPARRAGRPVDRRRRHPAADVSWLPDSITHRLEHWLEPVIEFGEAEHRRHVGRRQQDVLHGDRHRRRRRSASSSPGSSTSGGRIKAVEPAILANGWYYDQTVTDFMGGPGREAFEGAAWFDANVVDGAVNGTGAGRAGTAGELRKGQSGFVRAYAGDHRHRRRAACSPGSSSCEGCSEWTDVRGRVPDPHRARSSCRSSARWPSPLAGQPPARARQARRPARQRGHRRAERLDAGRSSTTGDAGFQFVSKHSWIEAWGISWHLGVDGISLFLVVLTGVLFPLAILGADPHHDEQAVPRLAAAARSRRDGQLPQPRPVRVLHLLRDRARADVLPHRRVGLRRPAVRGDEVLPVHDVRLGVHARRHRRHRVPRPRRRRRPR